MTPIGIEGLDPVYRKDKVVTSGYQYFVLPASDGTPITVSVYVNKANR